MSRARAEDSRLVAILAPAGGMLAYPARLAENPLTLSVNSPASNRSPASLPARKA